MEAIKTLLNNKDIKCKLEDGEYSFWITEGKVVSYKGTEEECIERLNTIESNLK